MKSGSGLTFSHPLVIKMMVAIFVWYFDAEFVEDRQRELSYEDAFIVVQVYAYQFP